MMRCVSAGMMVIALCTGAWAQGTKLWTVDRYDDFAKGKTEGVAIRSDGRLQAGPATSLLFATGGSYTWSIAADGAGNGFAGLGGTTAGAAVVMKITSDGKATKIFEGKELSVQALRVLADGAVVAGTSPDGKVYRVPATGGAATVLFDPATTEEKPKYIWDLAEVPGAILVATGAPAAVYRVPADGGKAQMLFRTTDQHIRCLLVTAGGTVWAGSDGSGVIYRVAAAERDARPFAVYAAPKREITALAADASGNVYAAGVGAKGGASTSLPPLPVTGNVGVSITFAQPGSANALSTNTVVPEGSEIYKIASNGAPSKLLTLKEDVVYGLAVRNGALLATTGNRGRVYQIDTEVPGRFTNVALLEAAQGMAFAAVKDGLLVGTSNSGKVFKLRDRVTSPAQYTSAIFDAQGFAQWGRAEIRAGSREAVDLYARSGNVESPLMGWSEWMRVGPDAASLEVPAARFVQWKAVLREGGTLDSVGLNYLQANVAPVVDEVVVQPGARVATTPGAPANTTVQVSFPATASTVPAFGVAGGSADTGPLSAQKDKNAVTVRWSAHDDNGDDLMFSVFYRGVGEANWRLLKDKISEKFLSFDASLLPDGSYMLKVVASDAPVHTDAAALKSERISEMFVVDTTPPVPGSLTAVMEGGTSQSGARIHTRLEVRDATSPIAHAEYSVDAGAWQYLEPAGRISDGMTERYDFLAAVPVLTPSVADTEEHVIAVRVYDRYENVVSVKAVVR